jgi:hypothetical protein
MRRLPLIIGVLAVSCFLALAQEGNVSPGAQGPPNDPMQRGPRGPRTTGTITAIDGTKITIKTLDGATVVIKTGTETQYRKDRQAAKLSDFKVGDEIFVGGELKDGVVQAKMVGSRPAGGPPDFREALGKRFIVGEVKAISGTQMTILRPDGVTQNITVDESTSFRKGQESVTLADVKVGDHVFGRGEMKKDVFVPAELNIGEPPFMGRPPAEGPEPQ